MAPKNQKGSEWQLLQLQGIFSTCYYIMCICADIVHIKFSYFSASNSTAFYIILRIELYLTCMFLLSPLSLLVHLYCLGQLQYCLHFQLPTMDKKRMRKYSHILKILVLN